MKNHKRFMLVVITIIVSTISLTGCFRYSYRSPCDYLDSEWVYTGEFGTIELHIPSTPGQYRGVIEYHGETVYIDYAIDSMTKSVLIVPITDEEYFDGINITNSDNLLLRGSFQCSSNKFVITSSHYSTFFGGRSDAWSNEKNEKIKLVFERVE